jgi:hypothetical protein
MAVHESEVEDLRLDDDLVGRLHAAREKNEVVERGDDPRRRLELRESHIRLLKDLARTGSPGESDIREREDTPGE